MNLFYTKNIKGEFAYLPEDEARHVIQVLRKSEGEVLHFTDGMGTLYRGEIIETGKKKCVLKIIERNENAGKRNYKLHIAIAPTKNIGRYEWFLEKATEMGVDEVTPIFCAHSERTKIRIDRLEKILIAASKQSLRAYFPKVNEAIKLAQFLKKDFSADKFIAHCEDDESKKQFINEAKKGGEILMLIGPEGDFSVQEIEIAKKLGFTPVALGNNRLRTETAGIFTAASVAQLNLVE